MLLISFWGRIWGVFGALRDLLGASWAPLWSILEAFGVHVGGSGDKIGVEHRHGRFPFSGRTVLEASWGCFFRVFGGRFRLDFEAF